MMLVQFVQGFRAFLLTILIVGVGAGLWASQNLNLDLSLSSRFMKDSSQLASYLKFQNEFGSEPLLFVVWEVPGNIFEQKNLARLKNLTEKLTKIDLINRVTSISSLQEKKKSSQTSRKSVDSLPLVRKLFAGNGGKSAVLLLFPETESLPPSEGLLLVKRVEKVLEGFLKTGEYAFASGPLAMQSKAIEYSRQDLFRAGGVITVFIFVIFGFCFRTWKAVFSALLIALVSLSGTCALFAFFQVKLSQFALMALPVLAVISLQDVVHLLENFYSARKKGLDSTKACLEMVASTWTPCLWTTLTTVVAFSTLLFSNVEQVRSIGLLVVIGAPIALLSSFLVVPALFLGNGVSVGYKENKRQRSNFTPDKWVSGILRNSSRILWLTVVVTVVSVVGFRYVQMQFDFPQIFTPGTPFQNQLEKVDTTLAGAGSFEIILETSDGATFLEPDKFKLIQSVQQAMSLSAPVSDTVSPVDIAMTFQLVKPESLQKVGISLYSKEEFFKEIGPIEKSPLKNWVSGDLKKVRIHVRVMTNKQRYYDSMLEALDFLKKSFQPVGVDVSWTGFSLLYKDMEKRMLTELITSFAIAFLTIMLMMILLFRSLVWGMLAMIPNLLPVLVTIGVMGWTGVHFSLGLIILPAVGLGMIVDDTIHIVWNLRRLWVTGYTSQAAVKEVCSTTGRALVVTTSILVSGFAALITSHFASNVQLALLMPLLLVLALVFDLVVVPAVLFWIERKAPVFLNSISER